MKITFPTVSRLPRWPWWAAALIGGWVVFVGVVAWLNQSRGHEIILCPLRRLTGVPCPTCGATRLVLAAGRGDLAGAFLHNPLVFLAGAVLAAVLVLRLAFARSIRFQLSRRARLTAYALLTAAIAANWAYVVAAGFGP